MKRTKIYIQHTKVIADLMTPVGAYLRLRDVYQNALLLESADYHDHSDSKSFICLEPLAGFEAKGNQYEQFFPNKTSETRLCEQPKEVFEAFRTFMGSFEVVGNPMHLHSAGLYGYSSFEALRYMEDIDCNVPASKGKSNPDLKYQLFRYVLVFDHFKNELCLIQNGFSPKESIGGLLKLTELLADQWGSVFGFTKKGYESTSISDEQFKENVMVGIAHCKRGDVFQVVLSREFRQAFKGDDFNVYRSLRSINPSPYLFYFDYGDFKIFGSSPESQLFVDDGVAYINPIAGTVRRSHDPKEDLRRAEHLKSDPKENAEHVMLVDLARNDLSKHSNQVQVECYAEVQNFSHVIHMVSKVSGQMVAGATGLDVYADTFPAGTLSGAPKYRALQIINENERVTRNFYGGAIGFFGFNGSVNHAIIIRSALSKNNELIYQAGAGIVAASSPESELQEVYNKVAALQSAIANAENL